MERQVLRAMMEIRAFSPYHSSGLCDLEPQQVWRGPNIAAVALANKNARVLWALLTRTEEYRAPAAA